ncbi:hypothetical protein [Klebsiella michiganensis]|uniref:hypothetical protein n=1 Tax=Klebsiella michiganensis TaxID=1134687 RepID=UPI001BE42735|nr:hypothetical protein [Klebsiella michiganensis]QWA93132.1 hypothetical protein KLH67_30870 [Klebsiella michiganensis]
MSLNVKKLFAMKRPCKDCPFLKNNPIPLVEGRIDDIKSTLLANDNIPFFCHKTTYTTGAFNDDETGQYQPSEQETYCMGAMAYLYAKQRVNVPMRLGLIHGLCDIDDIEKSVPYIIVE